MLDSDLKVESRCDCGNSTISFVTIVSVFLVVFDGSLRHNIWFVLVLFSDYNISISYLKKEKICKGILVILYDSSLLYK